MAKQIVPKCTCKICKTPANKIDEYIIEAKENGYSDVDTYVRENEGTYNPDTGYFYCTDCYIKIGMPLGTA